MANDDALPRYLPFVVFPILGVCRRPVSVILRSVLEPKSAGEVFLLLEVVVSSIPRILKTRIRMGTRRSPGSPLPWARVDSRARSFAGQMRVAVFFDARAIFRDSRNPIPTAGTVWPSS